MKKNRHSRIIEIMETKNTISIKELALRLDCTEMTIRRNLDELQEMNFVKREHGFVTLLNPAQPTDYYKQIGENIQEKIAIASIALSYVHPDQTICIDSGTTTQQLAIMLPDDIRLSVITSSLVAAMALSGKENIQVLLPSGFLNHKNRSVNLVDSDSLRQYEADVAFISCRSFRLPGGAYEHSQSLTATKKAIASIARKRILLLDYTKWGLTSLCNSIKLDQINLIITDNRTPKEYIKKTVELGKEIIIVNPEGNSIENHYNPTDFV